MFVGLTGTPFLALLVAATVLALIGSVVLWPRLAAPGWWRVLGRLGVLLLVAALVLATAGTALNRTYVFFTDWSDLFGATGGQVVQATGGGSVSAAMAAPVRTPSPVTLPPAAVLPPSSSGAHVQLTGPVSGVTSSVQVLLPAGYSDPANAHRTYPVIEAFPGFPGTGDGLVKTFDLPGIVDQLAAAHVMSPAVVVVPEPWSPAGRDTECANGPGGPSAGDQYETWVAVDVPAWVRAHFRVDTARTSWATFGISAGAWCAAVATMLHPEQFAAALSLAGYFRVEWGNWRPYVSGDPRAARYDLVRLAGANPPPVALWVAVSRQDKYSFPPTEELLHRAAPPLSVTAQVSSGGGHRFSLWVPWLGNGLTWLGGHVPGFAPTP